MGRTGPGTTAEGVGGPLSPRVRSMATAGALIAVVLASVDVMIVATAMPDIIDELGGLELYPWVGVSYGVVAAAFIPVAGKLGDMFGRKPFILAGLLAFVLSSLLAAVARDMGVLVAGRTLQGVGAAVLTANVFALLGEMYSAERRAQVQGVFFSASGFSMVIGPPLGGLLTDALGWRWIFYINAPLCALAFVAMLGIPLARSAASWRDIDFLGVLTLLCGIGPLLAAVSLAGEGRSWGAPEVLVPLVAGVLVLVLFYLVETRVATHPVLDFSLFRVNQVAVLSVVAFFSSFAMAATTFYVPLLYQGVLGVSATASGGLLIPIAAAMMLVPPVVGKLLPSVPRYRFLGTAAFAAMVGGLLLLTLVDPGSGGVLPVVAMVLVGIGIGVSFPLATTVVQSAVPPERLGVGTSLVQFWRTVAAPVSIAVLGAFLGSGVQADGTTAVPPAELAGAMHQVFLVGAVLTAIGLVATLLLSEVPLKAPPKPGK
ncbi:MFS transporter [Saccharothrix coeruleofusca]|uniref:MFS transporter n=2 Tax=Saccharothrix coeruleofusca TaxID=33919 RepID=A0A918AU54_9PSEU|nr:MFS transporter [Saccharothrix coeruleofusca]MBP2336618.1 EmrB/QacA subfamily drug resistance transporter [Saccharothrix coeruleofusca]GGP51706.1 MFS transporter [Saccharothrix coeruleofusca]GGP85034.1 MFS transporter [Saccharothrix coeruleofusca]